MNKKKKRTGFSRQVTIDDDGDALWSTGRLSWCFKAALGINLYVVAQGRAYGLCYAPDLQNAGLLSEGVEMGVHASGKIEAYLAMPPPE
jgi:hypothetical protein